MSWRSNTGRDVDAIIISDTEGGDGDIELDDVKPKRRRIGRSISVAESRHGLDYETVLSKLKHVLRDRDDLRTYSTRLEIGHAETHEELDALRALSASQHRQKDEAIGRLQQTVLKLQGELLEAKASPASTNTNASDAVGGGIGGGGGGGVPDPLGDDIWAFLNETPMQDVQTNPPPALPASQPFDAFGIGSSSQSVAPFALPGSQSLDSFGLPASQSTLPELPTDLFTFSPNPGPSQSTSTSALPQPQPAAVPSPPTHPEASRRVTELESKIALMQQERASLLKVWDQLSHTTSARDALASRASTLQTERDLMHGDWTRQKRDAAELRERVGQLEREKDDLRRAVGEGQEAVLNLRLERDRERKRADGLQERLAAANTVTGVGGGKGKRKRSGTVVGPSSSASGPGEGRGRGSKDGEAERQKVQAEVQRLLSAQAEAERQAREAEVRRQRFDEEVKALMASAGMGTS